MLNTNSSPDGFKQTEIGLIPEEWAVAYIKEHCEKPEYGYTESATSENVGPKFLRITDIQDMGVNWSTVPHCRISAEKFKKYVLREGDILFARIGATTGKSYIVEQCPPAVFASYLIRLRTKPSIYPKFLYYFFSSEAYWKQVNANKGSNLKKGMSGTVLAELLFTYPKDRAEQRAIAHVLSKIQAAAGAQAVIAERARELKRALMAKLFTEGLCGDSYLDGVEHEIYGSVPKSWFNGTLGDLINHEHGTIQTGPFGSQLHASDYKDSGVPVVNPTHMLDNKINHESIPRIGQEDYERLSRHILREGDILFARRGEIGRHAFITSEEAGWLCGTGCFLVRVDNPTVDNAYLSFFLYAEPCQLWLNGHAVGSIMPNLNTKVLRSIPVVMPPIDEQREIARILQTVDAKIATAERKRAVLVELFRAMLGQLMTGKVRVKGVLE